MGFFQNSVIHKYIQSLDKQTLQNAYAKFRLHFHNAAIQDNIRGSKEEQYQGEFLIDLFVNVLGYTKNPTPNFNLTTEYKNVKDSKKADGAIIINETVKAVIELKGTNTTDLNKIETQAFGYKNNQSDCDYVITSNFEKIRFYVDNAIEYVEFNLFTLTEKEFELLYICLSYDSISRGIPKQIKDESVSQEALITKKLYNDYSVFKSELYHSLVKLNPQYEPLELFKKSQKLLDRFLFIFFAEDRQLLPTNLIFRINKEWQQLREMRIEVSLYERYKIYFHDLDQGAKVSLPAFSQTTSKQKEEFQIYAYNGGLFKKDDLLNDIKIEDELLFTHTEKLSNYDFASEVDVNVLGHIFENSLNELDEIKAQLEGQEIDKTKTKRKKDGVFYTPKYITKYIVDNTVGKLCLEKKEALQLLESDYTIDKKRQKKTTQALTDKLNEYRHWLLQLTICDPACGSGAFLNQALDFLINEHKYIDELQAKLFGDALVLSDVEGSILENNLFGVDINEESVEIAKLSLWLRTAQPNRKLNDLNSNIKCGNSLIDDVEVAGDKAFNWEKEFKQVFSNGGFDVIIGNPPYVSNKDMHRHGMQNQIASWNKKFFSSKSGNYDIFIPFIEQGLLKLKKDRKLSFIIPNKFLSAKYSKHLLQLINDKYVFDEVVDYSNINVFEDASVYPIIITVSNKNDSDKKNNIVKRIIVTESAQEKFSLYRNWDYINLKYIDSVNKNEDGIIQKIESSSNVINAELSFEPGINGFQFTNYSKCVTDGKINNESKRLTVTGSIDPHIFRNKITRYLKKDYIEPYITLNTEIISPGKWALFSRPKVMVAGMTKEIEAALDAKGEYAPAVSVYSICGKIENLYKVQIIINSKLINWFFKYKFSDKHMSGGYISVNNLLLQQIPFRDITNIEVCKRLCENANKCRVELERVVTNFNTLLSSKNIVASKRLQNWYELDSKEFLTELNKTKIRLSLSEEADWLNYFNENKTKANEFIIQKIQTDKEIDQMVYKLYDLTEEEIAIVEKS